MKLSKSTLADLETLFVFQTNPEGVQMAAFTADDIGKIYQIIN